MKTILEGLAITAVLLTLTTGAASAQDKAAHKRPANQADGQGLTTISVDDSSHTSEHQRESGEQSRGWFAWPEGVTAWAIILTLLGILWQANETRKSAKAALLNAQFLIDSERAWIIAAPTEKAPVIGFIPEGESNLELHLVGCDKLNAFSCSFKSTGNTPALLVEVAVRYQKIGRLEDVPEEANYGQRSPLNNLALVKKDSIGFTAYLEPDIILNRADATAVPQGKAFLYAFGILVYRDVYDRPLGVLFTFRNQSADNRAPARWPQSRR